MTFRELRASASSVISVYTLLHACVLALLGPPLSTGWGFRGFFLSWYFLHSERSMIYYSGFFFLRPWRGVNPEFDSWPGNPVVLFAKLKRWGERSPPPLKVTKNKENIRKSKKKIFRCGVSGLFNGVSMEMSEYMVFLASDSFPSTVQ